MTLPAPVTYRFERADCWRLGQMLFRPSLKRRLLSLGFMAICLVVGLVAGIGHWPTPREWAWLSRSPQLAGIVVMLLALSQFSHYINIAMLWARFHSLAMAEKPVTVTFRAEDLEADVAGTCSRVPWANFVRRVEESDRVFLKIGRYEAFTIPRRAFPDDASWQGALTFLREKVPHAG